MSGAPTPITQYTPCRWCAWYGGPSGYTSHCYCNNPTCSRVRGQPEFGCCSWERAPGADDDADPVLLPYAKRLTPTSG